MRRYEAEQVEKREKTRKEGEEREREERLKQMEADMKKKHATELKNFDAQVMN
jgi:guanylate kinase